MKTEDIKLLILCTVSTGLDAVAEVIRRGAVVSGIIGISPESADPIKISGWTDVGIFAKKWTIPFRYVESYSLSAEGDREIIGGLNFNLVWVSGWQRLVPQWLINRSKLGVIGGHGSPDGIDGGRGRSPQNWAIILGCNRFDLALFCITPGVDDGPIVAERSFYYNKTDDIVISYKKASLCMGEMVSEVLQNPDLLDKAKQQTGKAYYYPQRKPEDGYIDWTLPQSEIWAQCRALTKPYPGLRSLYGGKEIIIWNCRPFDDKLTGPPGEISFVFEDTSFLVNCRDGRVIVELFECTENIALSPGGSFSSVSSRMTMLRVMNRHQVKYPNQELARRILNIDAG